MPGILRKISHFSAQDQPKISPRSGRDQPSVTVGTGLLPLHVPLNPKLTEPPLGTVPLYEAFTQVTAVPDWVQVAFQACVSCCPAPYVQVTRHDDSDLPEHAIVTWPVKPVFHWFGTVYVAVQPSVEGVPPRAWAIA